MFDFSRARDRMVEQIARRGIRNPAVLDAMRRVPRETFVEPGFEKSAYKDRALPIGEDQTISQPYIVALMIDAAEMTPGDRVLEVGAGSGYAAAIMSRIAERVYAIERYASLATSAQQRFKTLGYNNINLRVSDGTKGWPEAAPFDAIIASAGGPAVPAALKKQLTLGGRLIIPVGIEERRQMLLRLRRTSAADFQIENLGLVSFVPLIGEHAWVSGPRRSRSRPRH
jgi:protein-L-isoaspartate(D-aspartate) O-methyltransferase